MTAADHRRLLSAVHRAQRQRARYQPPPRLPPSVLARKVISPFAQVRRAIAAEPRRRQHRRKLGRMLTAATVDRVRPRRLPPTIPFSLLEALQRAPPPPGRRVTRARDHLALQLLAHRGLAPHQLYELRPADITTRALRASRSCSTVVDAARAFLHAAPPLPSAVHVLGSSPDALSHRLSHHLRRAGVTGARPAYRVRNTLAVQLLTAGAGVEVVAALFAISVETVVSRFVPLVPSIDGAAIGAALARARTLPYP